MFVQPVAIYALEVAQADDDVVVVGTATTATTADRRDLYRVLRDLDFDALVPPSVPLRVCLDVRTVVSGDAFTGETCFLRLSDLAEQTADASTGTDRVLGREGRWNLHSVTGSDLLFATRRDALVAGTEDAAAPAPRQIVLDPSSDEAVRRLIVDNGASAAPALRPLLQGGTPLQKRVALETIATHGVLSLIPDVIAAIDDPTQVTDPSDPIGHPVGLYAVGALLVIARTLDDPATFADQPGLYRFSARGLDYGERHVAIRADWGQWWADFKVNGPRQVAE